MSGLSKAFRKERFVRFGSEGLMNMKILLRRQDQDDFLILLEMAEI